MRLLFKHGGGVGGDADVRASACAQPNPAQTLNFSSMRLLRERHGGSNGSANVPLSLRSSAISLELQSFKLLAGGGAEPDACAWRARDAAAAAARHAARGADAARPGVDAQRPRARAAPVRAPARARAAGQVLEHLPKQSTSGCMIFPRRVFADAAKAASHAAASGRRRRCWSRCRCARWRRCPSAYVIFCLQLCAA